MYYQVEGGGKKGKKKGKLIDFESRGFFTSFYFYSSARFFNLVSSVLAKVRAFFSTPLGQKIFGP